MNSVPFVEKRTQVHSAACLTSEKELLSKLSELIGRLDVLEEQSKEVTELYTNLKSIIRVFSWIEKACVWIVKVGAVIGLLYTAYRFIITDIAKNIIGK